MDDELDLPTLRLVRALADTGTLTAAARRLGYSQPAASQQLRRAELRAGHPLVTRAGRALVLTEAGRRLAEHAVHVQAALDAARQDLDDLAGLTSGRVRVAGFPSASSTLVPAVFSRLGAAHPGLRLEYLEAEPPEALAALRAGTIDVALTFSHAGASSPQESDDLVARTPFVDRTVLVLPADHPFREGDDLGGLDDARWIAGCPRCRGHLLDVAAGAGFVPQIVLETDNALAVLGMVAAGLGVALLPGLALVSAAVPTGVRLVALGDEHVRRVHVVHGRGARRVPSVRAVVAAATGLDPADHGLLPLAATPDGASEGGDGGPG